MYKSLRMILLAFALKLPAPKLKSQYAYSLGLFRLGSSVCARCYLVLERLFSKALHQYLINIFVALWSPFVMSFVGVIGVLTTLQFTLVCPMGSCELFKVSFDGDILYSVTCQVEFFFCHFCLIFGSKRNCIVFKSPWLSYKGRVLLAST